MEKEEKQRFKLHKAKKRWVKTGLVSVAVLGLVAPIATPILQATAVQAADTTDDDSKSDSSSTQNGPTQLPKVPETIDKRYSYSPNFTGSNELKLFAPDDVKDHLVDYQINFGTRIVHNIFYAIQGKYEYTKGQVKAGTEHNDSYNSGPAGFNSYGTGKGGTFSYSYNGGGVSKTDLENASKVGLVVKDTGEVDGNKTDTMITSIQTSSVATNDEVYGYNTQINRNSDYTFKRVHDLSGNYDQYTLSTPSYMYDIGYLPVISYSDDGTLIGVPNMKADVSKNIDVPLLNYQVITQDKVPTNAHLNGMKMSFAQETSGHPYFIDGSNAAQFFPEGDKGMSGIYLGSSINTKPNGYAVTNIDSKKYVSVTPSAGLEPGQTVSQVTTFLLNSPSTNVLFDNRIKGADKLTESTTSVNALPSKYVDTSKVRIFGEDEVNGWKQDGNPLSKNAKDYNLLSIPTDMKSLPSSEVVNPTVQPVNLSLVDQDGADVPKDSLPKDFQAKLDSKGKKAGDAVTINAPKIDGFTFDYYTLKGKLDKNPKLTWSDKDAQDVVLHYKSDKADDKGTSGKDDNNSGTNTDNDATKEADKKAGTTAGANDAKAGKPKADNSSKSQDYQDAYNKAYEDYNRGKAAGAADGSAGKSKADVSKESQAYQDGYNSSYKENKDKYDKLTEQEKKDAQQGAEDAVSDVINGKDRDISDKSQAYQDAYNKAKEAAKKDMEAGTSAAEQDVLNGKSKADNSDKSEAYQKAYDKAYEQAKKDVAKGQSDADKDIKAGNSKGTSEDKNGSAVYKKAYEQQFDKKSKESTNKDTDSSSTDTSNKNADTDSKDTSTSDDSTATKVTDPATKESIKQVAQDPMTDPQAANDQSKGVGSKGVGNSSLPNTGSSFQTFSKWLVEHIKSLF